VWPQECDATPSQSRRSRRVRGQKHLPPFLHCPPCLLLHMKIIILLPTHQLAGIQRAPSPPWTDNNNIIAGEKTPTVQPQEVIPCRQSCSDPSSRTPRQRTRLSGRVGCQSLLAIMVLISHIRMDTGRQAGPLDPRPPLHPSLRPRASQEQTVPVQSASPNSSPQSSTIKTHSHPDHGSPQSMDTVQTIGRGAKVVVLVTCCTHSIHHLEALTRARITKTVTLTTASRDQSTCRTSMLAFKSHRCVSLC